MNKLKNKYQIIYMDPPGKYGGSGGSKWLRADNFYETISDKELSIKLEKPFEIRNRIMKMFPKSDKLEVFSRHQTLGWDVIGKDLGVEI